MAAARQIPLWDLEPVSDSVLGQEMTPALMSWGSSYLKEASKVQAMLFSQTKLKKREPLLLSIHWTVRPLKPFFPLLLTWAIEIKVEKLFPGV